MLTITIRKSEILMFFTGAFSLLVLLLLAGAGTNPPVGRYQLEIGHRGQTFIVYAMDTTTGAVKWVKSMDTPFVELKGD